MQQVVGRGKYPGVIRNVEENRYPVLCGPLIAPSGGRLGE
jgi:hypothetical protein